MIYTQVLVDGQLLFLLTTRLFYKHLENCKKCCNHTMLQSRFWSQDWTFIRKSLKTCIFFHLTLVMFLHCLRI